MAYVYNPLLGLGLDQIGNDAASTPGGTDTQVQFNDAGALAGDAGLVYNKTTNKLTAGGDVELNDGGTFTTTVQCVTPTLSNKTISLPNATGTVALVAGSSGQLVYNNAGAQAGAPGSVVGATGDITLALNGAASTPPLELTGTWFTGGTSTTTKPQVLIEPAGTTSTAWSTGGTGLGVNAASTFTGRLLDLQTNGTSRAVVTGAGFVGIGVSSPQDIFHVKTDGNTGLEIGSAGTGAGSRLLSYDRTAGVPKPTIFGSETFSVQTSTTGGGLTSRLFVTSAGNVGIGTTSPSSLLHLADAGNITVGTTTGTKIGTATTQKLGFYNKTPVVQPTAVADATDAASVITQLNALLSRMRDLGLIAT